MTNLFSLTAEAQQRIYHLNKALEEGTLDQQAYDDTVEAIQGELEEHHINIAAHIKNLESDIHELILHCENVKARVETLHNERERLMCYLTESLNKLKIKRIDHSLLSISFRKNPAKVVVDDENLIPREYFVHKPEEWAVDKIKLKEAISKQPIEGAHLESRQTLQIKV